MNSWAKRLDKRVKEYDSLLFIQEGKDSRYDVYKKSNLGCELPHFIFALTDTWLPTGRPIEYGIDVVINRIKAHDLWRDDQFIENYIKECEKDKESKERARKNSVESFLYDFHSQFKKTVSDINTSNMKKVSRKEG